MRTWFTNPENTQDKGYFPYLAVQNAASDKLILLGSLKTGKVKDELDKAMNNLNDLIVSSVSNSDVEKLMSDISHNNSNILSKKLENFTDILYLPNTSPVSPAYSPEMQLVFLLGVLKSQRPVAFCTDFRYNFNRRGAAILNTYTTSGELIAEGSISVGIVNFMRSLKDLRVHVGGTVLELYCLAKHGYSFRFSQDAKLIASPPSASSVTPVPNVFSLLEKKLHGGNLSISELEDIKQTLLNTVVQALAEPFLTNTLDDILIGGFTSMSSPTP